MSKRKKKENYTKMFDPSLLQKLAQVRQQELLHEAEQQRMLAQLPRNRRSISRYVAGKLGILLLKLGTRLKEFELTHTMLQDHQR